MSAVHIRKESPADEIAIRALHNAAFESEAEARLVDTLRLEARPRISLVAMAGGRLIGHILFTPVTLDGANHGIHAVGLGPMAVHPERQREGIGSQLVETGIARCWVERQDVIVVLGHPEFYPRFGFVPADQFGLSCEWSVPSEAFMALELKRGVLDGNGGRVRYHPVFTSH